MSPPLIIDYVLPFFYTSRLNGFPLKFISAIILTLILFHLGCLPNFSKRLSSLVSYVSLVAIFI